MGFPLDPWDNLTPEHQDLFWNVSGSEHIEAGYETDYAQAIFAVGFGYTAEEYDRMGISEDAVTAARDEYFGYMGLLEKDFDWEGWREAMGYTEQ